MNILQTTNGHQTDAEKHKDGAPPTYHAHDWKSYVFVFLVYLAVYLFVFRGVVIAWPDLIAGRSVLNTGELVPFFSPGSQLVEQASGIFSELTHGYEFRVRYSILTTWMRYYLVLPFAIIFAPLIGGFLTFVVVYLFLHKLLPGIPERRIFHGTAVGALFVQLILLPAKLTHFYTLILGFDAFLIAFVFLLNGLFVEQHRSMRFIVAASLITLFNPGVHFLILYPIILVLMCGSAGILLLLARRKSQDNNQEPPMQHRFLLPWKRFVAAPIITLFLTIIPYALFVKFYVLRGVPNLSDIVPDTFQSIQTSSSSLLHLLTFDLGSVSDNYLFGQYVTKTPRTGKIIYSLIAILPFFITIPCQPRTRHRLRMLLLLLLGPLFFSVWFSLGYTDAQSGLTFHEMLASLFNRFYLIPSSFTETAGYLISQSIHVLRFPHRFQFIYLAIVSILLPLGIATLRQCLQPISSAVGPKLKLVTTVVLTCLFFVPLLSHWEDRTALISGDVGGLIRPYSLQNIREIKDTLKNFPNGRMIILPSSDSDWTLRDPEGDSYKFIDKFYIYFLDLPSYYYGATGSVENKYHFFLLMNSLFRNDRGWINILRNLQVRYLVVNKELQWQYPHTSPFLQQIARSIANQPRELPQFFRLLKENESFALYEFTDTQSSDAEDVVMDIDWNSFICLQQDPSFSAQRHMHFLQDMQSTSASGSLVVIYNDLEKTRLDLYGITHAKLFVRPDQSSYAFNPDHIPSAQYFGTPVSMFNFLTINSYNKMNIVFPGPFDTITSSFVGLPKKTTIRFPISIEESGTYELLLRGATSANRLSFRIDNGDVFSVPLSELQSAKTKFTMTNSIPFGVNQLVDVSGETPEMLSEFIPKNFTPVTSSFYYTRLGVVPLTKGRHWLYLMKQDRNPLIIEGILLRLAQKTGSSAFTFPNVRFLTPAQLPSAHD